MITITATDLRYGAPAFSQTVVEYDPAEVEDFDTRDECHSVWEETWGECVAVPEGVLYLVVHGRGNNHTTTARNILKDA